MFVIVLLVAVTAVLVGSSVAARNARIRAIEEAFRSLEAEPSRTSRGVEGRVRGAHLHYVVVAGRSTNLGQTHCRAALSSGEPLAFEMDLRPQTASALRDVEHGRAIDLVVGDDAFDDTFIVEAAPAEMAHALLDEPARTGLLAFSPCRLTVTGNELHFSKAEKLEEFAEIRRVLELCSHVGSRLVALPSQLHERRLAQAYDAEPAGYRGPSPEAIRGLRTTSHAADELAELHRVRARRMIFRWVQGTAIGVAILVAYLLLLSRAHR